jgi:hypothetical protein
MAFRGSCARIGEMVKHHRYENHIDGSVAQGGRLRSAVRKTHASAAAARHRFTQHFDGWVYADHIGVETHRESIAESAGPASEIQNASNAGALDARGDCVHPKPNVLGTVLTSTVIGFRYLGLIVVHELMGAC